MHTTRLPDNWIALHNGDFSGEVIFRKLGTRTPEQPIESLLQEAIVPNEVLRALMAEQLRRERQRELDGMTDDQILAGAR